MVPMNQVANSEVGSSTPVRKVRCSHQGVPVLEATFRLLPPSSSEPQRD